MDVPSSSRKSPACLYTNRSPPLSPLLTPTSRQPTLHIISYDRATIPTALLLLQYDLQRMNGQSRHIRVNPSIGLSKSTVLELRGESHYASQLRTAEKEIRTVMERLQKVVSFHSCSSSTSSGEVIADWTEGLEDHGVDGDRGRAAMNRIENEFGVEYIDLEEGNHFGGVEEEILVLRVGCSCASGCHKSVAFAEELANMQWPGDWAVKVDCRDAMATAHANSKCEI